MANQTEVFYKLAEKYGVPGSELFYKVLEAMITPQEGDLLLELWAPMTAEALIKKLNADENYIRNRLAAMTKKGVLDLIKGTYSTPTRLIFFCLHTVNMSAITDKLWTDFFFAEFRYFIAKYQHENSLKGPTFHRILPALQALAASPHIPKDQILWYENLDAVLQRSTQIIFAKCGCRAWAGRYVDCKHKIDLCMHVALDDGKSPSLARWSNLKQYTYKEALAELYAAEDAGMCHLSQNHPRLQETCNCCEDVCRVINPLINAQPDYDKADPQKSRFQASINQDLCSGCQTCLERCIFKAVEMKKVEGSKKMKAQVIAKNCMGCGLCVYKCPQKAIRFDIVRPPSHIAVKNTNFVGDLHNVVR
jgi:electron transport complex protein RnfB